MVIYPWPAQLRYGQAVFDWEQFARDLCAEIKCRGLVDVFPRFRAEARVHADWYSRYFVVGDVHFNALANRMVAEEVAKALAHAKVASGSH
jgi:hypothetical protein